MSDSEIIEFLARVPLFEGRDSADLGSIARVMRRRTVRAGEVLWRQGEAARELLLVKEGTLSASLLTGGDRDVGIGTAGPGDVVGELGLIDGGEHTMTVRATEATTVFALGRLDFAALIAGQSQPTLVLKRRLAALFAQRLRNQLRHLAVSLGADGPSPPAVASVPGPGNLVPSPAVDSKYVRRMATFHDFEPFALWAFLTSGRYVRCAPGAVLLDEGQPSPGYFLTINGAVEKVLVRNDQRIRVGLAGPGRAFGYEGLIDGRPCPITAIARERAVLLFLHRDRFEYFFNGSDAGSRGFLDVIQQDLILSLRQTLRPCARLAASV